MKMDLIPQVHKLLRYKKLDTIDIPQLLMAAVSGHGDTIALYLLSRGVLWCLAGPRANGHFVWQLNIDYLRDGICEPIFYVSGVGATNTMILSQNRYWYKWPFYNMVSGNQNCPNGHHQYHLCCCKWLQKMMLRKLPCQSYYSDFIMSAMSFQISGNFTICQPYIKENVKDLRHQWLVDSPQKGQ